VSEMVVVNVGGSRAYSLLVDGSKVGGDDFLGIEDGHSPEDVKSILGLMIRFGADRAKAKRFLIRFKADMEAKSLKGGLLSRSGVFGPANHSGDAGKAYLGHVEKAGPSQGPARVFCEKCAAEAGHERFDVTEHRELEWPGEVADDCASCGASLWRETRA
jgi:hypothetical protein